MREASSVVTVVVSYAGTEQRPGNRSFTFTKGRESCILLFTLNLLLLHSPMDILVFLTLLICCALGSLVLLFTFPFFHSVHA